MTQAEAAQTIGADDVDTVTDAVLTASRLLLALSARSIAAVDESVTLPQFRLMVVLHTNGPLRPTALAEALGVNPSTCTRMVDRLVASGMVLREANPASRRELIIDLTATGREHVREVTRKRRAMIRQVVRRMAPATRRGMVRALYAFAAAGWEPPVDDDRSGSLWF